jgi:hypothetical protein
MTIQQPNDTLSHALSMLSMRDERDVNLPPGRRMGALEALHARLQWNWCNRQEVPSGFAHPAAGFTVPIWANTLHMFHDSTWGNDACPSFTYGVDSLDTPIQLFVDHPDPLEREIQENPRFTYLRFSEDGSSDTLLETNSHTEAAAFAATITNPENAS